ncbi:hypothetical protein ACMU_02990 [Actibacterium mucosum KCTC 23349]|uniref:Amino acid transporter n=1 Tax=Actibacterium mucosum KCTC 23349 TaxID=1454373 RepID=A0A037ZRL5_9RHOB|nr:LysE family translocator [Actibacterium mucosum]KAJ57487.1 hypothetical protein ACMU_02990 [Actibacterium mucosum KCTC 23349]
MIEAALSIPAATWLAFLAAALALNLTPGADVMFASATGLRGGPLAGIVAGIGVGLGSLVHIALAVGGVAALLAAAPWAFVALRWAGAGYLLWLAYKSWTAPAPAPGTAAISYGRALRQGWITNVLNPKVAIFVLAFLPQFADPALGPVAPQMAVLGLTLTVTGTFITCSYGALAGALGQRLARAGRVMNRVAAAVYAGLAGKLLLN